MKELFDVDVKKHGISMISHEMENGELRFRLVSENGSSYILTKSTHNNGWQQSHVHYKKREFYIVEKGIAIIALLNGDELKFEIMYENDFFAVPTGVAHNVLMCDDAIIHTIKFGTQENDWNSCVELDVILSKYNIDSFISSK